MTLRDDSITLDKEQFNHHDAWQVHRAALRLGGVRTIVIDFSGVREATTSAFARLVLLRRALLGCGRDLRLAGLRGRAALLWEMNRLTSVLPLLGA